MEYVRNLEINQYDEYANKHVLNSIFQSSGWAYTKSNWKPLYVGVKENGNLIGAALVLIRSLTLGFNFAYIPRGPLLDYDNDALIRFFFENLKKHLKDEKVVLAKFDPNLEIAKISFDEKNSLSDYKDDKLVNKLKKLGIKHCGYSLYIKESIQPRIQLEIDTEDYEHIIPSKTLKKIRNSYKKGVVIINEKDNVDNLVKMVSFTEGRHNINLRNKAYFKTLLDSFKDNACVFSAYFEDTLISSCLLVKCRDTCEILYSGYDDEYKKLNSTYLLRYEAIKYAKENGCKYFSFGGVEGSLDDGLTVFKSSFNPKIKIFIGEFDLLVYPLISNLGSMSFNILKNRIRL